MKTKYRYIIKCSVCGREKGCYRKTQKFCSKKCFGRRVVSKNTRDKIGKANAISMLGRRGEKSNAWKGGKYMDGCGYILIHAPDHANCNSRGYVKEHRLIMEAKIGRILKKTEVVHHINGDKKDNRIENLVVTNKHDHLSIYHRKKFVCKNENCAREHYAKGLCFNHYCAARRKNRHTIS